MGGGKNAKNVWHHLCTFPKRMEMTETLRWIWLFTANKIKALNLLEKQPTQLIIAAINWLIYFYFHISGAVCILNSKFWKSLKGRKLKNKKNNSTSKGNFFAKWSKQDLTLQYYPIVGRYLFSVLTIFHLIKRGKEIDKSLDLCCQRNKTEKKERK